MEYPMTRERVEQAMARLRAIGTWRLKLHHQDEYNSLLDTLSNALAESHPNDACRNFWKLVATTAEARLAESENRAELRLQSLDHMRDLYDAALERIAESEKEQERLREALPEADKLDLLADWFDQDDANKGGGRDVGVQADLRRWARDIRQALSPDSQEKP